MVRDTTGCARKQHVVHQRKRSCLVMTVTMFQRIVFSFIVSLSFRLNVFRLLYHVKII